ncbi:MAG: CBS domain-containing protein [Bacteroidetes bacterium]|nr:CBS domain-containing protein [Bacteroidota bacterium]
MIALIVLSTLFCAISSFRISFNFLSDNMVFDDLNDHQQSKIEKLLFSRDKINVTIVLTTILLIVPIVLIIFHLSYIFLSDYDNAIYATFITSVVLLTILAYIIPLIGTQISKTRFIISNIPTLNFFYYLLFPITWLILKIYPKDRTSINKGDDDKSISLEELSDAVDIVSKSSSPEDKKILEGLGWFVDAQIVDIMTHRTDMVAKDINITFKELLDTFIDSRYSRIPIYKENIDMIIGVMFVKDIIEHINETDFKWQTLIRKPIFIDDQAYAKELLKTFQSRKEHLAIVVDEYGSTQGVVTIEDILEEIVGEIDDESDTEDDDEYIKIDNDTYIFEGKISVNDFEHILDIEHEDMEEISEDADTLAGLFIQLSQTFPRIGATVEALNYRFSLIAMHKNRITKIKVEKIKNEK